MPIFRGLFLMLAIWLVFVLARHLYRSSRTQRGKQTSRQVIYTKTIPCTLCGTHTSKIEAIHQGGRYYCCEEHRIQYQNRNNSES